MTTQEFSEAIERIFRIQLDRENRHYQYYKFDSLEFRLKKKLYKDVCHNLEEFETVEGYEICTRKQYEVSITQGGRFNPRGADSICKEDLVNKISYYLGPPSNEYLIFFIKNLIELAESENITRPLMFHRLRNRFVHRRNKNEIIELFDILKDVVPRFITLQIKSEAEKTFKEFENLSSSFLFTLGFNTDLSYLPSNITEDFTRAVRIGRLRRSRIDDIEPPKRKYQQDLILFYQKGISSESADLQYLSFYHILEHFFEKIYNEDLLQSVKDKLTTPSFSYKRNQDLSALVKTIQDKLRYKNEEFQINEPEALKLVLDKFIKDFTSIKEEINTYDSELLEYYKTTEISFSRGNKVNFDEDRQVILRNLRERIYKTRNSVVHSKENDKAKYLPFKHDKELSKEIILMRIIAEHIIIDSSREL